MPNRANFILLVFSDVPQMGKPFRPCAMKGGPAQNAIHDLA
jgi:hypothetical protein